MRILIDYRSALRARSGVGEYTHQLVSALAALGRARQTHTGSPVPHVSASGDLNEPLDVTIFSSSWKDRLLAGPADVARVDRRIPVRVLNLAWHRLEWPPVELLTGQRYDIVHSLHPLLLPARSAAQVITIHDLHFLDHPERTRAEIRRDYPALVQSHAARADAVIVPSHFTAREVERRLGVPGTRIAVCSPGAPAWTPRGGPPAAERACVLFLGTLEPRKNVSRLVDAYERLLARRSSLPRLVLAGRAGPEAAPLLDRIRRAPLAGHVDHLGYVEPDDRRALYERAALLVLPSFEEGFGLPALEAMTAGVPVIVANAGALPEVVGDAGSVVEPDDADGLATAIERMLTDEPYAAACAAKGILRARAFDWHTTALAVLNAYRGALIARRERTPDIGRRTPDGRNAPRTPDGGNGLRTSDIGPRT